MRELTYWYQSGVLFMLDGLTLLQRNILGMVAGTEKRGLLLHNDEIARQFIVSIHAVKDALKVLRNKDYITVTKTGSPHRKIFSSRKTQQIIQQALRKAKAQKRANSTGSPSGPVENPTGYPSEPVTGPLGYPLPGQFDSQSIISKEVNQTKDGETGVGDNNSFSLFWSAYPRKVGKVAAEKSWRKLAPDENLVAVILAALEKHKEQPGWLRDNGRYIPHASTWLNNERWRDEIQLGGPVTAPLVRGPDGLTPRERAMREIHGNRNQ